MNNKRLSDNDITILVNNEKEWRRHIVKDLENIKKTQTDFMLKVNTLEVKMAFIGFLGGAASQFLIKYLTQA